MKAFKITDICINVFLLILFSIEYAKDDSIEKLINSYFIVGGWQCISMLVHAWEKWFTRKRGTRFIYHWITFISVITLPLGSYWILGATAPAMALFYTGLCVVEIFHLEKRPSELLGK